LDLSLLSTKLYNPPARPGLVTRPRLLERLERGLSCNLILVSAPAGFGKTTLISDWTRKGKMRANTAWLSLDEGDNDPVRFFDYFIAALKTLYPGIGERSLTLLHSPQPCPIESVLTTLINDLIDFPDDFALVVDDYHLVKAEVIQSGITFLLEHLPPRMHLIIAARADPPLPLSHFRGRGTIFEIGADDLRFTTGEAGELFNKSQSLELAAEDVSALYARTEGWAVGLTMAAISLSKRKDIPGFIAGFTGSQRYVMDYLVEEVLKQQSLDVQDFFLKTSVLDRMTAQLCSHVTGRKISREMLAKLESAFGGFLVPLDESGQWYRYHHLFAESLRNQLERLSGSEKVNDLHRLTSQWYEDNGFIDEAIRHSLAAQDWHRATELIAGVVEDRAKHGEMMTLLNWFQTLPIEMLHADIWLCRQYGRVLVQTGQNEAADSILSYLEKATPGDIVVQGEIAAEQSYLAYRRGDVQRTAELARKALALLPAESLALRARASYSLGVNLYEIGQYDEASSLFTDAFEIGRKAGDLMVAADGLSYLGYILLWKGKLYEAAKVIQQGIDLAGNSPAAAMCRIRLGQVLYEWNDLDKAVRNQELALELVALKGLPENATNFYRFLARTRQASGDQAGAQEAISMADKLIESRPIRPGVQASVIAFHGLLAIREGNLEVASKWSARLSNCSSLLPFNYRHIAPRLSLVRGENAAAREQLQECYLKAAQGDALGLMIEIRVFQALAATTDTEALSFLADALILGQNEGFIRTFVDEGKLIKPLLRKASKEGITPGYAANLIKVIEDEELRCTVTSRGRMSITATSGILSEREVEVLRLVEIGLSNRQIADRLFVTPGTIKVHVYNLMEKLNAKSRTQAVALARELKVI
jgi:LuxR family maltose regulon positive regulatory protein